MIEKGPGWSHFLRVIQFFPDLTNFSKFRPQGASQKSESRVQNLISATVELNRFAISDFGCLDFNWPPFLNALS